MLRFRTKEEFEELGRWCSITNRPFGWSAQMRIRLLGKPLSIVDTEFNAVREAFERSKNGHGEYRVKWHGHILSTSDLVATRVKPPIPEVVVDSMDELISNPSLLQHQVSEMYQRGLQAQPMSISLRSSLEALNAGIAITPASIVQDTESDSNAVTTETDIDNTFLPMNPL